MNIAEYWFATVLEAVGQDEPLKLGLDRIRATWIAEFQRFATCHADARTALVDVTDTDVTYQTVNVIIVFQKTVTDNVVKLGAPIRFDSCQ
jgi:hypothetical protein